MICCGGHTRRVYVVLLGSVVLSGAIFVGCNSSDTGNATQSGYTFASESATLTNRYFPAKAGHVITFVGHGSFEGSHYVWMFTEGETIQGIATLHETGTVINANGETSVQFDSMLAQDINGNVHVLKNGGELCGVAAGLVPTLLMPGEPKVGDKFAPGANYAGSVLSLDEKVDSYTGVLHTQFIVNQADNTKNQYDDYWSPGIGQVKSVWSLADGTTGYWVRAYPDFHTMQADLLACTQSGPLGADARNVFSQNYNVPSDRLEQGTWDCDIHCWGKIACDFEMESLIAVAVWRIRANMDGWLFIDECGGDLDSYCYKHARYFNHWQWHQGELESTMGHSCFRH